MSGQLSSGKGISSSVHSKGNKTHEGSTHWGCGGFLLVIKCCSAPADPTVGCTGSACTQHQQLGTCQISLVSLQGSFPCLRLLEQGRSWSLSQRRNHSVGPNSTPDLPAAWDPACWGCLCDTFCPGITFVFLSAAYAHDVGLYIEVYKPLYILWKISVRLAIACFFTCITAQESLGSRAITNKSP